MSCQKKQENGTFKLEKTAIQPLKYCGNRQERPDGAGAPHLGYSNKGKYFLTILFLSIEKSVKIMKFDVSEGFVEISIMTLEKIS